MIGKMIGASCVMVACGGYGFSLAHRHIMLLRMLHQLHKILDRMEWEMQYRFRTMPDLCRLISAEEKGILGELFFHLAIELENQIQPDVRRCMLCAMESLPSLPDSVKFVLDDLGKELGRYDLRGQLDGIERARQRVAASIRELELSKDQRIRGYKTLGLCAGAALIILFI